MSRLRLTGIVLCGGLSRRMGQDKAWLLWNGRPLLSHVVEILHPWVSEVLVVARSKQSLPPVSGRVVTDRMEGVGPLAGLEAGLRAMRTPYGVVVACDMPWLNPALIHAMMGFTDGCDLVIPCVDGILQPLHAIYAKKIAFWVSYLLACGERRMHALIFWSKARVVDETFIRQYDPSFWSLRSIDTWKEYKEAHSF